jgi:hypothetical protein
MIVDTMSLLQGVSNMLVQGKFMQSQQSLHSQGVLSDWSTGHQHRKIHISHIQIKKVMNNFKKLSTDYFCRKRYQIVDRSLYQE